MISEIDYAKIVRAQVEDPPPGETSLHAFMRLFWDVVEPRAFQDNWHLHAKATVLEGVSSKDLHCVTISEPPGSCKTLLTCVFWPVWHWAKVDPKDAWLSLAYDGQNVRNAAEKSLMILDSPLFQLAFPRCKLKKGAGNRAVGQFFNEHGAVRASFSAGENVTGKHYDLHIYDDLLKPQALKSNVAGEHQVALQDAANLIKNIALTRAKAPTELRRVLIAQRLHEMDPTGILQDDPDWVYIVFPEEYKPQKYVGLTPLLDPRTQEGELLWPERRPAKVVAQHKRNLGTDYEAQYNQDPISPTGGLLNEFHYYSSLPKLEHCQIVASWDLNFGRLPGQPTNSERSRVAWQLWLSFGGKQQILAGSAAVLDYAQTKAKLRDLKKDPLWSQAGAWLVEAKANGPAIMSDLKSEFNFVACEPGTHDKVERMLPHLDPIRSGEVLWSREQWCTDIINELRKVPRGVFFDHWDVASQALSYLRHHTANASEALAAWRSLG